MGGGWTGGEGAAGEVGRGKKLTMNKRKNRKRGEPVRELRGKGGGAKKLRRSS